MNSSSSKIKQQLSNSSEQPPANLPSVVQPAHHFAAVNSQNGMFYQQAPQPMVPNLSLNDLPDADLSNYYIVYANYPTNAVPNQQQQLSHLTNAVPHQPQWVQNTSSSSNHPHYPQSGMFYHPQQPPTHQPSGELSQKHEYR